MVPGHDGDGGAGVDPADADVAEAAVGAQGDGAVGLDAAGADGVAGGCREGAGDGFGAGGVGGGRGGPVRQGAVRPGGVVEAGELVEEGLQAGQVSGLGGLGAEPFLEGLLEPFDLALGLGVVGLAVLLPDPRRSSAASRELAERPRRRVVKTMPLSS